MKKYPNGGTAFIDCGGLNLLAQSSQTIAGLYAQIKAGYEAGKQIVATNCVYGEGVPLTPIPVFTILEAGVFVSTASILQIRVTDKDVVTITPLING